MAADTTASERGRVIATVLEELELTPHAGTRIDKLVGRPAQARVGGGGIVDQPFAFGARRADDGWIRAGSVP